MKLGKELCAKVCEIPPNYVETFSEVLEKMAEEKLKSMGTCDPSELPGLQKKVQALAEIRKAFDDAHKEATLYKS